MTIPTGMEMLPAGSEAMPTGIEAGKAGKTSFRAGSEAVPDGMEAIPVGIWIIPVGKEALPAGIVLVQNRWRAIPASMQRWVVGNFKPRLDGIQIALHLNHVSLEFPAPGSFIGIGRQ